VIKAVVALLAASAFGSHAPPAGLAVAASEFHLVLSRPSVNAGVVEIELQNDGQDPHDLRLRRVGGTHTFSIPLTRPGGRRSVGLHLRAGRYRLWCSVADHRMLGMQAVLRVRR
jgi:hypothetical protein